MSLTLRSLLARACFARLRWLVLMPILARAAAAQTATTTEPPPADPCGAFLSEPGTLYEPPGWWGDFVRRCPTAYLLLRDSVRRWRQRADTATVFAEEAGARAVRDGELAEIALSLMGDPAAPELARLAAMSVIKAQRYPPSRLLSAALLNPPQCLGETPWTAFNDRRDIGPLAPDLSNRVLSAALSITSGTTTSASPRLREAARCMVDLALVNGGRLPTEGSRVRLTYLCGNRFRVRNTNPNKVTVTYDVYGSSERDQLPVPGAWSDPQVDAVFTTINRGTVRLFLDGRQIDVKANGNRPCSN